MIRKLQFITIESKSLLAERLRDFHETILLGKNAESPNAFALASEESLGIGVYIGILGAGFAGIITPETHKAYVGHDCTVDVIDLQSRKVIQSINMLGPFFEFLEEQPQGLVLALHELGLVAFAGDGSVVHEFQTPDIVVDWQVIGNVVSLSLFESGKMKLNLSSGTTEMV